MANASAKKQAAANLVALKQLHLSSLAVNGLFVLSYVFLGRPSSLRFYLFSCIPSFLLEMTLDRTGRPKYKHNANGILVLEKPGENLAAEGVTEWMHDVLYIFWLCDILTVAFNSYVAWWVALVIPLYASYKIYGLIIAAKGGLFNSAADDVQSPEVSKRQEKLQKKRQKFGAASTNF